MDYTLITSTGKVMTFYIRACAECYQKIYGGVVITSSILDTETSNV